MVVPDPAAAPDSDAGESATVPQDMPDPLGDLFDEEFAADEGKQLLPATAMVAEGQKLAAAEKTRSQQSDQGSRGAKRVTQKGSRDAKKTGLIAAGSAAGLLVVVGFLFLIAISGPKPGYESPEEAFAMHQQAVAEEDWSVQFETYAPQSQEDLLIAMTGHAVRKDSSSREVRKVMEKYNIAHLMNADSPTDDAALREVLTVDDKASLYDELILALDEMQERKANNPVLAAIARRGRIALRKTRASGQLTDLTVEGNLARGTIVLKEDDRTYETPIEFRQEDGRWFIVLPDENEFNNMVLGIEAVRA
jgi:hypothetical protein